jgi:hypothetical protein
VLSYLLQDLSSDCELGVTSSSNPFLAEFLLEVISHLIILSSNNDLV